MKSKAKLAGIVMVCLAGLLLAALWIGKLRGSGTAATVLPARHIDIAAIRARADLGEPRAQWELGGLYARGEGVAANYSEAAKWYQRAADQGNADAQAALGELYQAGRGVSKDLAAAGKWFRLAADQRNAKAQYSIGFMYETGRGLPQDQAQAAKWYRLAAEQGDPVAQYDLAQRCNLGVGVPVDRVEALKWLTLAAARGQTDAAALLDKIKSDMTRTEISEARHRAASFSTNRL